MLEAITGADNSLMHRGVILLESSTQIIERIIGNDIARDRHRQGACL